VHQGSDLATRIDPGRALTEKSERGDSGIVNRMNGHQPGL
jgi:hypothetical protein